MDPAVIFTDASLSFAGGGLALFPKRILSVSSNYRKWEYDLTFDTQKNRLQVGNHFYRFLGVPPRGKVIVEETDPPRKYSLFPQMDLMAANNVRTISKNVVGREWLGSKDDRYFMNPVGRTLGYFTRILRDLAEVGVINMPEETVPNQPLFNVTPERLEGDYRGKTIVRPYTLGETIRHLIEACNTAPYDLSLLESTIGTSSAVFIEGRKSRTKGFYYQEASPSIFTLGFSTDETMARYNDVPFIPGTIFDCSYCKPQTTVKIIDVPHHYALRLDPGRAIYNLPLTFEQFLNHRGWRTVIGEDDESEKVAKEYWKLMSSKAKDVGENSEKLLAFNLPPIREGISDLEALGLREVRNRGPGIYHRPLNQTGRGQPPELLAELSKHYRFNYSIDSSSP